MPFVDDINQDSRSRYGRVDVRCVNGGRPERIPNASSELSAQKPITKHRG